MKQTEGSRQHLKIDAMKSMTPTLYPVSKYPPAKPEALKTVSRSKRLRGRYRGPAKP